MNLYVYGTLMVPDIMRVVCGHSGNGEGAMLAGYRRRCLAGVTYPAIVEDPHECVDGILYRGVTTDQCALLDRFESDQYSRDQVIVESGGLRVAAQAYVLRADRSADLTDQPWSLDTFMATGLARFRSEYGGFDDLSVTNQDDIDGR